MAFKPEKDKKLRHVLNRWKRFVIEGSGKESEAGPSTASSSVPRLSQSPGKAPDEKSSATISGKPLVGPPEHEGIQE